MGSDVFPGALRLFYDLVKEGLLVRSVLLIDLPQRVRVEEDREFVVGQVVDLRRL